MSKDNFMESIKIVPDKEKEKLLKIQDELEKEGITLNHVLEVTKNLTENEKQRLKQLYQEQINDLKISTDNYKKRIIKIKSNMQGLKKVLKNTSD